MRNSPARTPEITVAPEVYDAILLAEQVIVVAAQKPQLPRPAGALPDFFAVRRCLLTTGAEATPPAGLLHQMVGG